MGNKINAYKINYRVGDKKHGYEEKEFVVRAICPSIAAERAQTIIWHTEPSNKHKDFYRVERIDETGESNE